MERDRPAEVLLRLIPGAGMGYEWLQGPAYFLNSEVKAEWRHDQTPAPDSKRNDFRYLLNLGWAFE